MSLLLEALKKAEKAKEEALRRERGEPPATELRLAEEPADAKPIVTRAELPDIRQPLEILSDDLAESGAQPAPAATPATAPTPTPAAPPRREAAAQAADRATARNVFEAKFREPNPRLPFFITLGALGVFALGTVVYFWYQLRPPPPLVHAKPVRPAAEAPVQVAQAPLPAQPATPAAQGALPGLPAAVAARPAEPQPPAAEPVRTEPPRPKPRPAPRAERAVPAAPVIQAPSAPAPAVSSRPAPPPQVHPGVQAGYAAYLAGDFAAARAAYQEALREQPANRDALLGVAAIDLRTGRLEAAEATYLRLLQLDPNDAHAQASLIALRSSRLDPLATESRVKNMLAASPGGAEVLHFTLGNQLAQQSRWEEAQEAYFKAFAASPDNPDFAYNLAVSLDHLRQRKLALEYYRRAVSLAERRGASFDLAAARRRAAELEK